MCVLGLLMLLTLVGRKQNKLTTGSVLVAISVLFMVFWYTMQGAGIQDYKIVTLISFLWLLPVARGFLLLSEKAGEKE